MTQTKKRVMVDLTSFYIKFNDKEPMSEDIFRNKIRVILHEYIVQSGKDIHNTANTVNTTPKMDINSSGVEQKKEGDKHGDIRS